MKRAVPANRVALFTHDPSVLDGLGLIYVNFRGEQLVQTGGLGAAWRLLRVLAPPALHPDGWTWAWVLDLRDVTFTS